MIATLATSNHEISQKWQKNKLLITLRAAAARFFVACSDLFLV
jgi:hypothetical protein